MTKSEFIATAAFYPNQINIWYTPAPAPYYILGITVPVINAVGNNVLEYLQQSTVLTIEVQTGNYIQLPVANGEIYTSSGVQFYFLQVTPPYDITAIASSPGFLTSIPITTVIFSNVIDQQLFNASGYNATLNNVEINRTSTYILQEGTDTPASIQDSQYSSTGWINGRYDGTKTSAPTYVGVSPTVLGNAFDGAYFPRTVTDNQIKAQVTAGTVIFSEYLNTGDEALPSYFVYSDAYIVAAVISGAPVSTITTSATEIPLLLSGSNATLSTRIPQVGDILQIATSTELIKIKSIGSYPNNGAYAYTNPLYRLTVERGYNYTNPAPIVTTVSPLVTPIASLSVPLLLFRLQGNKVQGLQRGKLIVKASGDILHVDRLGYIVSGSK